jgi:uncharacterized protein YeeX (DUF496 family)
MENKTQRIQFGTYWLYKQQDYITTNLHQWYTSSICQYSEISWYDPRCQVTVERAHKKKERWAQHQVQENVLVWLLGHNSELSVHNKIILYKQVIRPVWRYGIQLWDCASDSNTEVFRRYQKKSTKCIVSAPGYVRNSDGHLDLGIETVTDIIANFANSHEKRLQNHISIAASRLLNVNNITKRLKRKKPFELVNSMEVF